MSKGQVFESAGWGGRIRTCAWRYQKPLPYRLATPQYGTGRVPSAPPDPMSASAYSGYRAKGNMGFAIFCLRRSLPSPTRFFAESDGSEKVHRVLFRPGMVRAAFPLANSGESGQQQPPMTGTGSTASPLFLREDEIRRGIELLYFGHSHLTRSVDAILAEQDLGRAHQRALYFIARQPDLMVSELLALLAITKQSLGRVLNELVERQLVETRPGKQDRRQKLLHLTAEGAKLEARLFEALRAKMASAYVQAGQGSVSGFWHVLEGLIPEQDRQMVAALRDHG